MHLKHFRNRSDDFTLRKSCPLHTGNRIFFRVFQLRAHNGEADVKAELQRIRAMTEARIKSGTLPDWSWQQHVQLIEAVDAMLHDMSLSEQTSHPKCYAGGPLRLVTDISERPRVQRATRMH